jgi:hypothetical protein
VSSAEGRLSDYARGRSFAVSNSRAEVGFGASAEESGSCLYERHRAREGTDPEIPDVPSALPANLNRDARG